MKSIRRSVAIFAVLALLLCNCVTGIGVGNKTSIAAAKYTVNKTVNMGSTGKAKVSLKSVLKKGDTIAKKSRFAYVDAHISQTDVSTFLHLITSKDKLTLKQDGVKKKDVNLYSKDHVDFTIPTAKGGQIKLRVNLFLKNGQSAFIKDRFSLDGKIDVAAAPTSGLTPVESNTFRDLTNDTYYLYENEGKYYRIERVLRAKTSSEDYLPNHYRVEMYNSAFQIIATKEIDFNDELNEFYSDTYQLNDASEKVYFGKRYNFLFFDALNDKEDNNKNVILAIKFDKEWNKLSHFYINNINSVIAGINPSGISEYGDLLYCHTAHIMYKSSDGKNHQANLRLVINQETDKLVEKQDKVSNMKTGYVSHSCYERNVIDGNDLYSLDEGDGYPRAFYLAKYKGKVGKTLGNPTSFDGTIIPFDGSTGDNYNGAVTFGFEVSDTKCLIFYAQDKSASYTQGIKVTVVDKNNIGRKGCEIKTIVLSEDKGVDDPANNVYKLSDNRYAVCWEVETDNNEIDMDHITLKYVIVDGEGNIVQSGKTVKLLLKCTLTKPILVNGKLMWYRAGTSLPLEEGGYMSEYPFYIWSNHLNEDVFSKYNSYFDEFTRKDFSETPPIFCELDFESGELKQTMAYSLPRVNAPFVYWRTSGKTTYFEADKGSTVHLYSGFKEYTAVADKPFKDHGITIGDVYLAAIKTPKKLDLEYGDDLIWTTKDGMKPSGRFALISRVGVGL